MLAQRIAFIAPRFSEHGTVGGAETLIRRLAEHAAAAGRTVRLLTTCAESHYTWENKVPPGVRRFGNLEVHFFPVDERDTAAFLRIQKAIGSRGNVTPADEQAWIANSVNSTALYEHLRERGSDYDRIVAGPYLFGVTWFAAQVYPLRTFLVPCLHDEPFAHLGIMRKLFGSAAGFLFNSEPERDLARRLYDVPERKCAVVGMGIEPFEVNPKVFAARRHIGAPYVIYSGRREDGKGTPLLCDYMAAFRERTGKDVKLVFTGSGDLHPPAELAPHVTDAGFVTEPEKREAMAGAVAFVHPSVNESLGIVLLESWMAGTPALVHAKSPVLQWQCHRSGAGLWFRNYADFEEELLLLLGNEELRNAMGRAGREYVRREYAWEEIGRRFFGAIDRI